MKLTLVKERESKKFPNLWGDLQIKFQRQSPKVAAAHMSMATNQKKEAETSNEEALSIPIIPNLPQEIIVEDVIRFRSVSKYWNSLISFDPQFATLQFKNSQIGRAHV